MRRYGIYEHAGEAGRERGGVRVAAAIPSPAPRRRLGSGVRAAIDRRAEAASKTVDAASEAIAYESGYEGAILEPADIDDALLGLTGDIRRAPVTALAIASWGLTPSSSLLRELDLETAASLVATRVGARESTDAPAAKLAPVGFYGL